tara:strand:- start:166 stop:432 length:267 start_codon:yes stop_codon:yes gene_type:complete
LPLAQNNAFSLTTGDATTVLDVIGPGPTFGDFGVDTVEQLFMGSIGMLSDGDSVVLNGLWIEQGEQELCRKFVSDFANMASFDPKTAR